MSYFSETVVNIEGNKKLRVPQIEAYIKIKDFFSEPDNKEALVVLPTGTGKSGLISIAPFGVAQKRVLIITPGLVTKNSIKKTQEVLKDNFWINHDILFSSKDIPVVCEYLPDISKEHLEMSHIIYSNIQKVSSSRANSIVNTVPNDFFDFIIIDEAHHAPAQSWKDTLDYFCNAKVLHVTGTPYRGDQQELPGTKIHETPLSEAMRDRYVKWLRKETVNAHELYFYTKEKPGIKLSKDEVLAFKDSEWIEKSVALSEECSKDVIEHSINRLQELRKLSPTVPHKILAVGCSIAHAEDLHSWYREKGLTSIIVHSQMEQGALDEAFRQIDQHNCDVVISVNMLMEGYDHIYLSILTIFRPYRSLNAFAQVIGRILRAIPEEEISAFEIDNNGLVIYHEETGLNNMWHTFQTEVDRARKSHVKDYNFGEREYVERAQSLADVNSSSAFITDTESYLNDIDFNTLFEQKRLEVSLKVTEKINKISEIVDLTPELLEKFKESLVEDEMRRTAEDIIDPELIEKRPALAAKQLRQSLTKKVQNEVSNILIDSELDEKSSDLYRIFGRHVAYSSETDCNDALLVRYINTKLASKFGPVARRDNKTLIQSIKEVEQIIDEIKRMLK